MQYMYTHSVINIVKNAVIQLFQWGTIPLLIHKYKKLQPELTLFKVEIA